MTVLPLTCDGLFSQLSGPFSAVQAANMARRLLDERAEATAYAAATATYDGRPAGERHRLLFRSAWVLSCIWDLAPERLLPFAERFCRVDFEACNDPAAQRLFARIMSGLLRRYDPGSETLAAIADTAARWLTEPAAKVSVRVWAIEVLLCCRDRVPWVAGSWSDLMEVFARAATPGLASRLRRLQGK